MLRLARLTIATTLAGGACASIQPAAPPDSEPAESAATAPPSEAEPMQAAAPQREPSPRKESAPDEAESNACPEGMILVEGEYCSEVEHDCKKSWFDESNKKTVCEEFAPEARCVGKKEKKRFCIDRYAWPNKKGERPEVMNRYYQAQMKCAAEDKRLCSESEWTFACEGPEMKPFPYGYIRDTNKCHGDVMWDGPNMKKVAQRDAEELARLWKGVRSGSQPECVSDFGVYDLPGNNDEIVSSETFDAGWRGKFDSVHTGGPWYKGVRNQCRPKIYTHDEGFYYYFLGFRCCQEPDGAPTSPLTAKQKKQGWDLKRVERLAGWKLSEVKEALKQKAEGRCSCKESDKNCRTLCGTLLAPSAKDYK
jgi:hypothetical protein